MNLFTRYIAGRQPPKPESRNIGKLSPAAAARQGKPKVIDSDQDGQYNYEIGQAQTSTDDEGNATDNADTDKLFQTIR